MNKDLIFDAMEYIDDDMLEEVNELRFGRSVRPNRIWMRYISVAACVCIVIGAVYLADRTGLIDRVEMEDCADQENMSGESLVHSYIRADIVTSDNMTLAVTDPQKITDIYDILGAEFKSEAAADDNSYSENDNGTPDDKTDGSVSPEHAGGITAQSEYTITLVSADGDETVYTLTGKVVCKESTGETFRISNMQYNELMEILSGK